VSKKYREEGGDTNRPVAKWQRPNGPSPVRPICLDIESLDSVFEHIWCEARPWVRFIEEWPRVGVGGGGLK
jgi:hypothetical protein